MSKTHTTLFLEPETCELLGELARERHESKSDVVASAIRLLETKGTAPTRRSKTRTAKPLEEEEHNATDGRIFNKRGG